MAKSPQFPSAFVLGTVLLTQACNATEFAGTSSSSTRTTPLSSSSVSSNSSINPSSNDADALPTNPLKSYTNANTNGSPASDGNPGSTTSDGGPGSVPGNSSSSGQPGTSGEPSGGGTTGTTGTGGGSDIPTLISTSTTNKVAQFGMLVNDLRCGFCHLTVNGDIASTGSVGSMWNDSFGTVNGTWFLAGSFNAAVQAPYTGTDGKTQQMGQNVTITASGGFMQNDPTAPAIPKNPVTGAVAFPTVDFTTLAPTMNGSVSSVGASFNNVYNGNLVLVGTPTNPLKLSGEILVNGDLVIKGTYTGIANIYVTGNIYIPGDILAERSPFPYATDVPTAMMQAKAAIAANMDALALATPGSIFVSDIESHPTLPDGQPNGSVFTDTVTPPEDQAAVLGVYNIYNWFPGGEVGYDALYDTFSVDCVNNPDRGQNGRSLSRIDAFLYAEKAIGGRANLNSYSINGGVIANTFHIVSGAVNCPTGIQPITHQEQTSSYVNYDWRLRSGLLLLKQFAPFFEAN